MPVTMDVFLPFSSLGIMGLGPVELVIALAILLLVLGPSKLPKLGSAIGKSYGNLKKGIRDGKEEGEALADDSTEGVEVKVEVQAPEAIAAEPEAAEESSEAAPEEGEEEERKVAEASS